MSQTYDIPRLVIAGAASNVGKTTVTCGLIGALRERGFTVQPFKCGPDYIDPSWHTRAAARPCRNLDAWMLDDAMLVDSFVRACHGADMAIIEGVMGIFDGADWDDERGSTAQIAKLLGAPIALVVDISATANSAALPVLGCQAFDPQAPLAAVVLNLAGSEAHARGCASAVTSRAALPVVGWLPREERLRVPERHLGLLPPEVRVDSEALIAEIAAHVAARFDLQALIGIASRSRPVSAAPALWSACAADGTLRADGRGECDERVGGDERGSRGAPTAGSARPVLAVARDEAFCFYYPENLELLQAAGAALEYFSPIRGERPSAQAAGVYLGGGYPELYAAELARNAGLWRRLHELRSANAPIYAECGGFMALTEALHDLNDRRWPMAGLIPGVVRMSENLAALGYRHATALGSNMLIEAGASLRAHEFRYSTWEADAQAAQQAAWQARASGGTTEVPIGYADGNLLASYLHVHFGQNPTLAPHFVERLARSAQGRYTPGAF